MVTDAPSEEHPNVRRARFEAVAREELVEPLRRYVARRAGADAVEAVLAETLLRCWQGFDGAPERPLPWAREIADEVLAGTDVGRPPAADPEELPDADPAWVTGLLSGVVGQHTDTESRRTGTRGRSRFTWVVAAVAVVVIGSVAAYVVVRELGPAAPVAGGSSGGSTLELALPADTGAGRCMVPTPELLRDADVAVDATAVEVSDGQVRLRPSRVFAGDPVDEVVVAQATPDRLALLLGVRFQEGRRYLVAASGGDVLACGFSGAPTPRRERLYERAFLPE